jgi:hypothetical protein
VPQGQKLMRRGFRWRDVRTVAIGLKPVVLRVKVNRARSTIRHPSFARDFRVGFDKGGDCSNYMDQTQKYQEIRHVASELRVCKLQRAILNIP